MCRRCAAGALVQVMAGPVVPVTLVGMAALVGLVGLVGVGVQVAMVQQAL